jgi:antirestriction protein ArdC
MSGLAARDALLGIAQRLGVRVTFGEYRTPSYVPDRDVIYSPHEGLYVEQNDIVSHLAHELVHATGCRLGRKQSGDRRSKIYAEEELVAEMGAALLLAHYGLDDTRAIENSAAYVQGWATFIKSTPAAFVRAASNAQKAVDFIVAA